MEHTETNILLSLGLFLLLGKLIYGQHKPVSISKQQSDEKEYICPITHEIMSDPVIAEDGNTYERSAILQWLKEHNTSPITREIINTKVINNNSMRTQLLNSGHKLTKIEEKKITYVQTNNSDQYTRPTNPSYDIRNNIPNPINVASLWNMPNLM